MSRPIVLVVDDEPEILRQARSLLQEKACCVETASGGHQAIERVRRDPVPDLVLLDMVMPEIDGLETLERLRELQPLLPVIVTCSDLDQSRAIEAMCLGARHCLAKPFDKTALDTTLNACFDVPSLPPGLDGLAGAVVESGKHTRSVWPSSWLAEGLAGQLPHDGAQGAGGVDGAPSPADGVQELAHGRFFVCASPAMRRIRAQAEQVARVDVPVLLLGESGTGKEVVAHLIHSLSSRDQRTFLKVNCAALPAELLESELFGYEAGAFTGAVRLKPGKFELCNQGTILLDEIAEMPPSLQAKLLHVLQDQEFTRLGGCTRVKVDVRVLAATNVNIQHALAAGKLREDLFYRLSAFILHLPALRERPEDIPMLLRHFVGQFALQYGVASLPLSERLLDAALRYPWPGNVRELENFTKRYLILEDEDLVLNELNPEARRNGNGLAGGGTELRVGDLKAVVAELKGEVETEAIRHCLQQTNWNRKKAARQLRISYKTLLNKMRHYGLLQSGSTSSASS